MILQNSFLRSFNTAVHTRKYWEHMGASVRLYAPAPLHAAGDGPEAGRIGATTATEDRTRRRRPGDRIVADTAGDRHQCCVTSMTIHPLRLRCVPRRRRPGQSASHLCMGSTRQAWGHLPAGPVTGGAHAAGRSTILLFIYTNIK